MTESNEKAMTETTESTRGFRKTREGYVVSDKMDKTVVVAVEDRFKHPLYGKVVRRTSKLKAHDEKNLAKAGDFVEIIESRPMSRSKRWRVLNILQKIREVPAIEAAAGASGRKSGPSEK